MSKKNKTETVPTKKGGAFKTFLSVVFFILILASALVLALCMSISHKSGDILDVYSGILGNGLTDFLSGKFCFWIAISAVVLWFGLWIATTKRAASAIRGLGIGCTVAPLLVLLGELGTMLIVCTFKFNTALAPFADVLPSQFLNTSGKNCIFMLSGAIIAAIGIFICKIKKLPKNSKTAASQSETTAVQPENDAAIPAVEPAPVAAYENAFSEIPSVQTSEKLTNIDIPVSDIPVSTPDVMIENAAADLAFVCHMCGEKNEPNVKFCGKCGAKLL